MLDYIWIMGDNGSAHHPGDAAGPQDPLSGQRCCHRPPNKTGMCKKTKG